MIEIIVNNLLTASAIKIFASPDAPNHPNISLLYRPTPQKADVGLKCCNQLLRKKIAQNKKLKSWHYSLK